jgi:DNA-binding NarL/FixJ family response regulator
VLEGMRARGIGNLLAGDAAAAAESLAFVWQHLEREGVEEPAAFPVAAELVEALCELGQLDQAQAITDRLRELCESQDHPWGAATTRRCAALVQLASQQNADQASTDLAAAAAAYAALGLRFDRARSLLSLGRAQRRLRKWGAARATLDEAAAAFEELGSPGWVELVRAEHAQVGGRRPKTAGELTPAEQRVAGLAAEGLANKEIAQRLVVSVRTVELHLKHAYEKLGISSRAQLARRLAEHA